jgi:hypothetical protein
MFDPRTNELLERSRRERRRAERLRAETRALLAQSLVLVWHMKRFTDGRNGLAAELAGRAERAKRNRETVVRSPRRRRSA